MVYGSPHRELVEVDEVAKGGSITLRLVNQDSLFTGIQWQRKWGKRPKKGDFFYIVTKGFGYSNEGFERLDGTVLKTKEDYEREQQARIASWKARDEENYQKNHDKWNAEVAALPPVFRERIQRFIDKDGEHEFWTNHGTYEMFCVSQANMLFQHWVGTGEGPEWFDSFKNMKYEEQNKLVPTIDEGHSGNTHGAMIYLAHRVALGLEI